MNQAMVASVAMLLSVSMGHAKSPALCVYDDNFAVVSEDIDINLIEGQNTATVGDITALLQPDSVILLDPAGKVSLQITEQIYRVPSPETLLREFEGSEIEFERAGPLGVRIIEKGKIIRAPGTGAPSRLQPSPAYPEQPRMASERRDPIIEVNGRLKFELPGKPLFPAQKNSSFGPSLDLKIQAGAALPTAKLHYISGGLNWKATYNLVLPRDGNTMTLFGWIDLTNESGRTFSEASVELAALAAPVDTAMEQRPRMEFAVVPSTSDPSALYPAPKELVESRSYKLPHPITLRDRETTRIEFVRLTGVESSLEYVYQGSAIPRERYRSSRPEDYRNDPNLGAQSRSSVWTYRQFKPSGQSVPALPRGRLRIFREQENGALTLSGESDLDHTAADAAMRIYASNAPEISGERKRTKFEQDKGQKGVTEAFEIVLRNQGKAPLEVKVVEPLFRWPNWTITESSGAWLQTDKQIVEFLARVEPGGEKRITYTVQYHW